MDIAEEVVQEVFFRIWKKRATLNIPENIDSYLYRAVHNESLNVCKSIEHENNLKNQLSSGSMQAVNFNDPLVSKELIEKLNTAIEELPEKSKEIFKVSRLDSLSQKEIAEKFGITVKGVEFHITKALKILRHELKEYLHILILVI
jgi:RNA polymerase sigma-70 factor (ECF subfamily)